MKVIAILGRKGGSGKSTVSHLLAQGLSSLDYPTIMMQTDVRSKMPEELNAARRYFIFGIESQHKSPEVKFVDIYERCRRFPGAVLIVDGGANRRSIDFAVAAIADAIIIPSGFSQEECDVSQSDLQELTSQLEEQGRGHVPVALLANRWPGDSRRLEMVLKRPWVQEYLQATETTRLNTIVPDLTSMMDMTNDSPNATLNIKALATRFAQEIIPIAQLSAPLEIAEIDERRSSAA